MFFKSAKKSSSSATQIDEELPPYSLVAPDTHGKRRKKHKCSKSPCVDFHSTNNEQERNNDCLNCQMNNSGECVWLHNLSQVPVFVTSPTLEPIPFDSSKNKPLKSSDKNILSVHAEYSDESYKRSSSHSGKNFKDLLKLNP